MTLSISWQWMSSIHESTEVRETGAKLKIALGREALTRNVDEWSRTVSDEVRLSAYPLALWLASNWWRLRWEPLPTTDPTLSWRMSHELAAAGYGYVWPRILFASDGEVIQVWAVSSDNKINPSPISFLTATHGVMRADEFERAIDNFLGGVVARLEAVGIAETTLQSLVAELAEERADASLAAYRRLEAIAGFDAGEGPSEILDQLEALIPRAGLEAVHEIATLCASPRSEQVLAEAIRIAGEGGLQARPTELADKGLLTDVERHAPAWVRGKDLALELRRRLAMNGQPISDSDLHNVMGITSHHIADSASQVRVPLGLAVREAPGQLTLHPRRRSATAFRFELARYLCDHLMASEEDRWLPVTDSKTSRQKAQRAFAAEFLCPIDALTSYLGDDFSDDAIEDAANHFRVSSLAVQTQLVNNRILPRELLADFEREGTFPYRSG